MALDKQDVTIDFGQGTEQHTDTKRLPIGKLAVADNIYYPKDKQVARRAGMALIGSSTRQIDHIIADDSSIFGTVTNTDSFSAAADPVKISSTTTTVVSPTSGHVGVTDKCFTATRISTGAQSARAASAISGEFLFVAYTEAIATNSGYRGVLLDVYEHATGRGVNQRIPVQIMTTGSAYPRFLRVVAVGTTVYVFFVRDNAGSTRISYVAVSTATTTPVVGAVVNLTTIRADSPFDLYQDPSGVVIYTYVPAAAATDVTTVRTTTFGGSGSWTTTTTMSVGNVDALTISRPRQTGDTSFRVIVGYNTTGIAMLSYVNATGVVTQTAIASLTGGHTMVTGHLSAMHDHVNGYAYALAGETVNGWLNGIYWPGTFSGTAVVTNWRDTRLIAGIGFTTTSRAGYFLYENNASTYVGSMLGSTGTLTTRLVSSLASFTTTDRTVEPSPFVQNSDNSGGWWSFCTTDAGGETYASTQTQNTNHVYYATLSANTLQTTVDAENATYFVRGKVSMLSQGRYTPSGINSIPNFLSVAASGVGALNGVMSFIACYVSFDKQGRRILGAFSEPTTVTPVNNAAIAVTLVTPPVDEEDAIAPFAVEVYATDPLGATYYRVATLTREFGDVLTMGAITVISGSTLPSATNGTILPYTTGGALENIPPAAPKWIMTARKRLWCPSPENNTDLYFSSQPIVGEDVRWNPLQLVQIPAGGGAITAVLEHNQRVVVFKEHAVYVLSGDGPGLTGQGGEFSVELLSSSYGCESPVGAQRVPQGLLFKTVDNGWWLLGNDYSFSYNVGRAVDTFKTATVVASCCVAAQNQVRYLLGEAPTATAGGILCYDYQQEQWSRIVTTTQLSDMCVSGDDVYYLYSAATSRVFKEDSTVYTDVDSSGSSTPFNMNMTTGWLNFNNVDGFQRVRWMDIIGTYASASTAVLKVDVYRDYDETTVAETHSFTLTNSTAVNRLMGRLFFTRQKTKAFKLKFTFDTSTYAEANVQGMTLTALNFRLGLKSTAAPADGGARRA